MDVFGLNILKKSQSRTDFNLGNTDALQSPRSPLNNTVDFLHIYRFFFAISLGNLDIFIHLPFWVKTLHLVFEN
ncbi:hypothetical protein MNB_SUP05-SYMBIONT-5-1007 [hydrothermal vent metagenome]|uniref:Uncharacterized protein n=1 Tax=hydrothermal vent metagenome TaxID=652676 RepID=A0A1W1E1F5_9ZZZZ